MGAPILHLHLFQTDRSVIIDLPITLTYKYIVYDESDVDDDEIVHDEEQRDPQRSPQVSNIIFVVLHGKSDLEGMVSKSTIYSQYYFMVDRYDARKHKTSLVGVL